MKLTVDEDDDWGSLKPLAVQSDDYPTRDSAPEVCGVWRVNQVFDQHTIRPKEEEEDAEHKATLLDALTGLKTARNYTFSYYISIECSNIFLNDFPKLSYK